MITHFDLVPTGQEAWIADRNGGISHVDFRDKGERRRWEIAGEGRASKLGGLSVNRKCTWASVSCPIFSIKLFRLNASPDASLDFDRGQ